MAAVACIELVHQIYYGEKVLLDEYELMRVLYPSRPKSQRLNYNYVAKVLEWVQEHGLSLRNGATGSEFGRRVHVYEVFDGFASMGKVPIALLCRMIVRQPVIIGLKNIGADFDHYEKGFFVNERCPDYYSSEEDDFMVPDDDGSLDEVPDDDGSLDEDDMDGDKRKSMGHVVVAGGWVFGQDGEIYFHIQNSYGETWGNEGYGFIRWSFVDLACISIPVMCEGQTIYGRTLDDIPEIAVHK